MWIIYLVVGTTLSACMLNVTDVAVDMDGFVRQSSQWEFTQRLGRSCTGKSHLNCTLAKWARACKELLLATVHLSYV